MTVVVTQPYLPAYRVPLFNAISEQLHAIGLSVVVFAGAPSSAQARRGDSAVAPWVHQTKSHVIRLFGHEIRLRPLRVGQRILLVTELDVSNFLAWSILVLPKRLRPSPIVLWGHGASYDERSVGVVDRLRVLMVQRADMTLTYTEGGRSRLLRQGAPQLRVKVIGNSTDTQPLRRVREQASQRDISERRANLGLTGPTALFCGGLDGSKRIDFLAQAARAAFEFDPTFKLIVVGRGELAHLLDVGVKLGYIIRVDDARDENLARLGVLCSAVWMPGRVGLVAVDALAMGLSVLTLRGSRHAPEIEYLREGIELFYLPDTPLEFARNALALSNTRQAHDPHENIPSVEAMAEVFVDTVQSVVEVWSSRRGAA